MRPAERVVRVRDADQAALGVDRVGGRVRARPRGMVRVEEDADDLAVAGR